MASILDEIALTMAAIDIVSLVVIFLSILWGMNRGFSEELSALVAWGGAILLSYFFYHLVAERLTPWISDARSSRTIAIIVSFIVLLVILRMISRSFAQFLKKNILGNLDRILGIVFGAARGYLVLVIVFIGVRYFFPDTSRQWLAAESHASAPIQAGISCFDSLESSMQKVPTLTEKRDIDPGGLIGQP